PPSAHHSAAPSFPTRRSSDLIGKGKCNSCESLIDTTGIRSHGHTCEVCGEVTYLEMIEGSTIRFSFHGEERTMLGPELNMEVFRDRKSTRLNSSHVKISYAVF